MKSLILFVADHSGIILGDKAQPLSSSIMFKLLQFIANATGIDLEEVLRKSDEKFIKDKCHEKGKCKLLFALYLELPIINMIVPQGLE